MNIKKQVISLLILLVSIQFCFGQQNLEEQTKKHFNFYIANDLGRNGYYEQKPIAELMGQMAENINIEFISAPGDVHHFDGVASINDPLWMTNYELIYSHPELMIQWYPLLGNHEYRGNTQAVLDYTKVSRRWVMPARYYTQVYALNNNESIRIIYLDTTPLIDKYRMETEKYPDAVNQSIEKQTEWLENTLKTSKEKWKLVIGHHPIYAQTPKDDEERADMQKRVDPILRKYKVDMYVSGHIHNFQHIKLKGTDIDYVVNTSASKSRKVKAIEGTVFCSPDAGFSLVSADADELKLYFINSKGEVLHTITKRK